jgi:hypothetical protein
MPIDPDLAAVIQSTVNAFVAVDARLNELERKIGSPRSPEVVAAMTVHKASLDALAAKGAS